MRHILYDFETVCEEFDCIFVVETYHHQMPKGRWRQSKNQNQNLTVCYQYFLSFRHHIRLPATYYWGRRVWGLGLHMEKHVGVGVQSSHYR